MLERLTRERDVDYVIVHKVDRLARNRADDVTINLAITEAGARLVSVSENIDETPSGMLLHGIMSSIAEFYSRNLATEITKGMHQKAKKGIHPGRAPIGYLNVRELSDGHEIRTIAVDPERAELISWAFQTYATGDYTILQLAEELEAKGLTTRATPKNAAKPLFLRHVHNLLRNPFYVGLITWGGVEQPGTHEPLVDVDTFAKVQAVLASHRNGPEKQRRHNHYLRSTVFCGRCQSRLIFTRSRGHGGEYDYFLCLGRHQKRNDCDLPGIPVDLVEDSIERYYQTIQLPDQIVTQLYGKLLTAIQRYTSGAEKRARQQRKRVTRLEAERRKLLQAFTAGAIELDLLQEAQARLTKQIADAGAALAATEVRWETIERNLQAALGLAGHLGTAYQRAGKQTKRHLNQAIFDAIYVDIEGITYTRLAEPFAALLADDLLARLDRELQHPESATQIRGVKENTLVEVMGLEPTPRVRAKPSLSRLRTRPAGWFRE
jgi:DNA invertase Pin-like site-specific DNA recombinase